MSDVKLYSSQFMKEDTFPFWIKRYVHNHENTPPIHGHDFVELIYVVDDGDGQHIFEGESYDLKTNDVFIINPGESHTYKIQSGKQIEIINCLFLPNLIKDTWLMELGVSQSMDYYYIHPFLDSEDRFHHRLNLQGEDTIRVLSLLRSMSKEFERKGPGFSALIRLQLVELLILLSRNFKEREAKIDTLSYSSERNMLIRRICGYLERHFDQKISVSTLCDLFNISSRHLNRLFKQETGLTIIEMVHKIRIEKAKLLLSASEDKVVTVATKVGYDDPAFFSRLFRRNVGCSPGQYRTRIS